ncbi:division/cell wall cluster transcriptional repressor MraZ [Solicola sp. PLA-1-18]|uniref:division/cell wall cluster transcriptional repressor MraZ n=1 Tax=Solicola sp. PLA-1-18 TaxID=3380532 RepID=UPI003B81488A
MFVGTYTPRLDDKGRLFLPAKFREQLAEGLVLTKGGERCVFVWTAHDFGELTARMQNASFTDKKVRDFSRSFFAGASDEVPDKQGRVTVPPLLREYARLERDCVVLGTMNRLEIWDAARWAAYSADQEEAFSQMSEDVMPGIF